MSIDPVSVVFSVGGIAEVEKAFKTVDQVMARFERARRQSGDRAVRESRREAGQQADAHIRETERWHKYRNRMQENSARMAGAVAKRTADAETREAKRAERSAEAAERTKQRIRERSASMAGRDAKRAADAEIREQTRSAREMARIRERSASMAGRLAERQAAAEARAASRAASAWSRDQTKARANLERTVGKYGGAVSSSLGRVTSTAMALGGAAMAVGGGLSVADAYARATSAERAAVLASNSTYIPGPGGHARVDPKEILKRATSVQALTNIDKTDLIQGFSGYVAKASDPEGGLANLEFFAKLAKGSGTSLGDITGAAGELKKQNANLSDKDMKSLLQNIVAQGKLGAVEISDLAHVAGQATATSAMYAGNQGQTQAALLGLAQVAIKTSGSPEEAATTISRLGSDALKHKDQMPAGTFDEQGRIKDPNALISSVFAKTNGNLGKIQDLGFGDRSIRLFEALAPTFQDAEAAKKGSGVAAVKREVSRFTNASYSDKDVQADFAAVMATNAERIDVAMTSVRETLQTKLLPYLERFANKLPELLPKIERIIDGGDKLASWFLDNPIKGVGAVILASVAKDLAGAAIGAAVKNAIVAMLSGFRPPVPPVPGAGVPPVLASPAAAVTAGAVAGAALGYGAVEIASRGQVGVQTAGSDASRVYEEQLAKLNSLPDSPEKKGRLLGLQSEIKKQANETRTAAENVGPGPIRYGLAYITGQGGDVKDSMAAETAALKRTAASLEETLSRVDKALGGLGGGTPGLPNKSSPGTPERNYSMSAPQRGGAQGG